MLFAHTRVCALCRTLALPVLFFLWPQHCPPVLSTSPAAVRIQPRPSPRPFAHSCLPLHVHPSAFCARQGTNHRTLATFGPQDVANALLPTYVVTLLFFSGFLFRFNDMPPWWKWYSYINFLRYAWSTLMRNQVCLLGRGEEPQGARAPISHLLSSTRPHQPQQPRVPALALRFPTPNNPPPTPSPLLASNNGRSLVMMACRTLNSLVSSRGMRDAPPRRALTLLLLSAAVPLERGFMTWVHDAVPGKCMQHSKLTGTYCCRYNRPRLLWD